MCVCVCRNRVVTMLSTRKDVPRVEGVLKAVEQGHEVVKEYKETADVWPTFPMRSKKP